MDPPALRAEPLLALVGCVVTLAALLPAYFSGGVSLASTPRNLWFNIPLLAGATLATGLLARKRWTLIGTGMLCAWVVSSAPYYIRGVTDLGDQSAGPGFLLGETGFAFLAGAAFAAAVRIRDLIGLRRGSRTAVWAALGVLVGGIYVVGDAMQWRRITVTAEASGFTFNATRGPSFHRDCCTFSDMHGASLYAEIGLLCAAVLLPLLAAGLRWRIGVGVVVGLGFVLVANPLSTLVDIGQGTSPAALGLTAQQISDGHLGASITTLPGLWVAFASAMVLTLTGVIRGLSNEF